MAEEQKKCERCETNNPAKTYDPRTPGHLDKTVNLCDECAAKDPKVVPVDNKVPDIDPAIPATPEEPDIVEFATQDYGPAVSGATDSISIPTPKSAPSTEPVKVKPVSTEPIQREDIRDKLAKLEKNMDDLIESRQRILAQIGPKILRQLNQVNSLMDVIKVRIAEVRDILGKEG